MVVEFAWTTRLPTDLTIQLPESIWATGAPAMNVIHIVAGGIPIGTLIVTAIVTTAGVVEATVETEIATLMAATVVTGVTDVARGKVGEVDDTHPITSTGAAGAIREALLVEVAQPEAVVGITMLLPGHLLRLLLPIRLR
jgi:hypothetical protein